MLMNKHRVISLPFLFVSVPCIVRATIDAMGIEKVMLGTDFLYEDVKAMVDFIGDNEELTAEEKKAILSGNAEKMGIGII